VVEWTGRERGARHPRYRRAGLYGRASVSLLMNACCYGVTTIFPYRAWPLLARVRRTAATGCRATSHPNRTVMIATKASFIAKGIVTAKAGQINELRVCAGLA